MKKFIKLVLCCALVSVMSLATVASTDVFALEEGASARAIETYTRTTNVQLAGEFGYVKVTLYINHNMTTGKSYISRIEYMEYFNESYILLFGKSLTTDPDIEEVFTGAIQIKITYKYSNNNTSYTAYGYIQL